MSILRFVLLTMSTLSSFAASLRTSFVAPSKDTELLPSERDPLLSQVESETYGGAEEDDEQANLESLATSSIAESRRYESLASRLMDVIKLYWYLGLIAFGGPTAHVAILRDHLVRVHQFIDEDIFMELFSLGQGLPGPSSTQLVISTAATHAGLLGGLVAFFFWCLPGYLVLTVCGLYLYDYVDPQHPPIWLLGVPAAAMALIVKSSYGFVLTLDKFGVAVGLFAAVVSVMINGDKRIPSDATQIVYPALLVLGALATFIDFAFGNPSLGTYVRPTIVDGSSKGPSAQERKISNKIGIPLWQGAFYFLLWLGLLVGSVAVVSAGHINPMLLLFESFFRIGSLIFGGGVVMIPMAQSEFVVNKGWMTDEQFFQGIGLAQSLPGPVFNFAAFVGATTVGGWSGATVANCGLFGPGLILIFAMLPIWSRTRHLAWFKAVLKGLNASAIGLIVAGCIFLYAKSVQTTADAMVFVLAGGLAALYNVQAPGVILSGVVFGALFSPAVLNVGQMKY